MNCEHKKVMEEQNKQIEKLQADMATILAKMNIKKKTIEIDSDNSGSKEEYDSKSKGSNMEVILGKTIHKETRAGTQSGGAGSK